MRATARPPSPAAWSLLGVMAAIFLGPEQFIRLGEPEDWLSPSVETLQALGGLDGLDVWQDGQGWRLLTAALLHASPMHLLLNGLSLVMAGQLLEAWVGRAWFLALFVAGAAGGGLLSIASHPPQDLSVGASGAIMGLLAAAAVSSFHLPPSPLRRSLQWQLGLWMLPSLVPLAPLEGLHIDYANHLGGALAGGALGALLLAAWRRDQPRPGWRPLAWAIAAAGGLAAAWGALHVVRSSVGLVG